MPVPKIIHSELNISRTLNTDTRLLTNTHWVAIVVSTLHFSFDVVIGYLYDILVHKDQAALPQVAVMLFRYPSDLTVFGANPRYEEQHDS